jgi:GNAT superfamily N-acetyltransferase
VSTWEAVLDPLNEISSLGHGDPVFMSVSDEARFGIRVARAPALTSTILPAALGFCREQDVRLLIARVHRTDRATLQALRSAGFIQMDALMCWSADLQRVDPAPAEPPVCVRSHRSGEADAVRTVALRAFRGYLGHYHADARLDPAACDALYADWAYRSCGAASLDHMLVAEVEGRIAGFGSVRLVDSDEAIAVLGGVDPAFRESGVFSALVNGRLSWCKTQGAARIYSTTLATNTASQRAYIKAGLRPSHPAFTFHKWFDEAERDPRSDPNGDAPSRS